MTPWLEIVGVTEGETPVVPAGRTVLGPKRLLDAVAPTPNPTRWDQLVRINRDLVA